MDNQMQQNQTSAEATEVEKVEQAAADLGKFKSVSALMQAYSDLEAEFTRRSQRLKELEQYAENNAVSARREAEEQHSPNADQEKQDRQSFLQKAVEDPDVKNAVIGAYVKGLAQNKNVPLTVGGVSVPATKSSPKSLHDAGELTKQFLQRSKQSN